VAVAAAIKGWQGLCDEERDSVTISSIVLTELSLLGAPPPILGAAVRVLEDEVRHVAVCTTVIERLGGVPTATAVRPRENLGAGAPAVRCARVLCAGYVAGEPLSAACFAAARDRAVEPLVRWAYTELLRDEARHGAFGAQAAAWVMRDFAPAERRALWPDCVREMEGFEARAGGALAPKEAADEFHRACEALGMVPRATVQAAILAAIPRWILPKLSALGVVPATT
jgi:hypothetical protein